MIKLLLPLLLLQVTLNNNNTELKGRVLDKESKEELCGVRVIANNDTTYTDFDGRFEIKNVSENTKIQFDLISYEKLIVDVKTDIQLVINK